MDAYTQTANSDSDYETPTIPERTFRLAKYVFEDVADTPDELLIGKEYSDRSYASAGRKAGRDLFKQVDSDKSPVTVYVSMVEVFENGELSERSHNYKITRTALGGNPSVQYDGVRYPIKYSISMKVVQEIPQIIVRTFRLINYVFEDVADITDEQLTGRDYLGETCETAGIKAGYDLFLHINNNHKSPVTVYVSMVEISTNG